jgi:hypothetical protein
MSYWGGAAAVGKIVLAEAAAILNDNSKATDIFISGVQGAYFKINGLYSPTQATGHDGRISYRKSNAFGNQEFCIEHYEGEWRVIEEWDGESGDSFAYVQGGCALEKCRSGTWKVYDGEEFVDQPSVKMVTGHKAKSKASGKWHSCARVHSLLALHNGMYSR